MQILWMNCHFSWLQPFLNATHSHTWLQAFDRGYMKFGQVDVPLYAHDIEFDGVWCWTQGLYLEMIAYHSLHYHYAIKQWQHLLPKDLFNRIKPRGHMYNVMWGLVLGKWHMYDFVVRWIKVPWMNLPCCCWTLFECYNFCQSLI